MTSKRIAHIITTVALVLVSFSTAPASSVTDPLPVNEPGIDEHLGASIPADVQLNDESGQKVSLKALIDKPTVLTLNYFRCGGICTPQLNNLVQTLNKIDLDPGKDFQVITVSFDPTDTFGVAATKRANYLKLMKRPFPPSAWRFLTGDAASTKAVADAVGFGFKQQGDAFIHPGALIIVSPQAKVTRYIYGINYLPSELTMAVADARSGIIQPTIRRALSFCYTYDPAGRKYVINITRVAGSVTLLLAGIFVGVLLLKGRSRMERVTP